MSLKVIGAGLGRTGTMSLKLALEKLLGGPCYHMTELFNHLPEHTPYWHAAACGENVDWDQVFGAYVAAVDEPASLMWQTLLEYYPDALVILSVRDPHSWWKSADATIMRVKREPPPADDPDRRAWHAMIMEFYKDLYPNGVDDPEHARQVFRDHMARVKAEVPENRLLIWQSGDGWEPICKALDLPVPDEEFPHTNTTAEFLARKRAQQKTQANPE